MEVFGDETPRQNSRVQRNAMMNRVGSDKRILLFSEVIPDSAAFISCLEPSQEEIDPAPGWPWRGLESDWSDTPDRGTPARPALSLWCLRGARRGKGSAAIKAGGRGRRSAFVRGRQVGDCL